MTPANRERTVMTNNASFADAWRLSLPRDESLQKEETRSVPEPEDVIVDGVTVHIEYREYSYGRILYADLYIDYDAAQQLTRLPEVQAHYTGDKPIVKIHLTSEGVEGDLLTVWGGTFRDMQREIQDYKVRQNKIARRQEAEERLHQLVQGYYDLMHLGRPVERLEELIRDARLKINRMSNWYAAASYDTVLAAIRTVEKEAERIKDGGSQLLINDLLNGLIFHSDAVANQAILAEIDVFSIRTGNVLETEFTEGRLYDFYADRIGTRTKVGDLATLNLAISLEEYIVDDNELGGFEVAPKTIELPGNKGPRSYDVGYAYKDVNGHKTAVATVKVPYKVYDEIGYEYGRKSQLPKLPHGILWQLEVTLADTVLASGFDDKELRTHVEKRKKGLERGDKLSNEDRNRYEATTLPPWARGIRVHRR